VDKTFCIKTRIIRCSKKLILIFILLNIISACNKNDKEVHILFVGDILLSRNVNKEIEKTKISPWVHLDSLFHSVNLVVGNLEGAVGQSENNYNISEKSPIFAIDNDRINLLKQAGFSALSIENNHSFDLDSIGKENTFNALIKNGITPISYGNSPQFITINNIIISIIAINTVKDRNNTQIKLPSVEISQKIRLAKALSNYVIIKIHWGSELLEWPNKEQRYYADWLTKQGVDLIIGSHPHVIQQAELVNGKPVFFSLGNHLFDQKYKPTKKGLIVDIIFKDGKVFCKGLITETTNNSYYPKVVRKIDFNFKQFDYNISKFKVDNYTLTPTSFPELNNCRISLNATGNNNKWETKPMPITSISVCNINSKEHLFMLKSYYSSLDKEISLRPYVYKLEETGLNAKWRGSALAWPLIDAKIYKSDSCYLFALHRGDSFLSLNKNDSNIHIATYKWNGFGFNIVKDSLLQKKCEYLFELN